MKLDQQKLKEAIERNLLDFVGVRSDTNSLHELDIEQFFSRWASRQPYFQANKDHFGFHPIGDFLGRHVCWCLRKGEGPDTVVMIHHNDCVETADYSGLEHVCLKPYELIKAFRDNEEELPPEIEADLDSGRWIFGRGVADMKGGGAIELSLMESYCAAENFKGNVVILSLPDEENLSAGMRAACFLLKELKARWNLNYVLMLNTEPHEREEPEAPIIYNGSVGKVMPVVYVRGKLAHVGQVFSGLNPINLLAEIVRRSELNPFFIERGPGTVTPPATWLYFKDRKDVYDVSLPIDAVGYMSVLPLEKTPKEIMETLKETSRAAFEKILADMNESYAAYLAAGDLPPEKLPFKPNVKFFAELYQEALRDSGPAFEEAFEKTYGKVKEKLEDRDGLIIDAVNDLIAVTLRHVKDPFPMVVIALAPPYYPSVNNAALTGPAAEKAGAAIDSLINFARENYGENYGLKSHYTGISDLSYAMYGAGPENMNYIRDNMLLWGEVYNIPLELIEEMSMPVVNIGPWGKDFHKYTERVYSDDLFRVTPLMVHKMVCDMLGD